MKYSIFENGGDIEGSVSINGLTMTGKLKLLREATEPNEAVNKQFVDNAVGNLDASKILSGTMPVDRFPGLSGDFVSVAGSGLISLKNTGVIPGNYTKVTVNNSGLVISGGNLTENDIPNLGWEKITEGKPTTLAGYGITDAVNRNNGTVNGNVTLAHDPIDDDDVVTKAYADNALANRTGFAVGDIVMNAGITTPTGFLRCNGGQVSKVLYPELYNILLNSANTVTEIGYTSHSAMGAGKPWKNQYDFNNSQSTDITGWTTGPSLPEGLQASQAIVTKNRVYLLGGYNGISTASTVYTASINTDGTLGTWTTGTSLPVEIVSSQAIVTKNRVYLLGGGVGGVSIYTAPINEDGTLGTWANSHNSLPEFIPNHQAIVTKNRVYLLGGYDDSVVSTVYTASINEDGTLGAWTTSTSLPVGLSGSQAIVTKNRVYLLGGDSTYGSVSSVYTAPINEDGTLGTWTTSTSLPVRLSGSQAIVTKNRVYLLGGDSGGKIVSTVYTAPINEDGTLGTWTTGTSLPGTLRYSQAIVTKNRVYLLGGGSDKIVSTVYTAPLPGSESLNDYSNFYNGTINKFDGTSLSGKVVLKQGGKPYDRYTQPGAGKPWKQQYSFNNQQDSNITGWTTGTNLPRVLDNSQAIVTKNRVYLLGGWSSGVISNTYSAPINEDGTLGVWSTGTNLPEALYASQAIVTKNRVYLLGGGGTSIVYTTTINEDGTLGTWAVAPSLPGPLSLSQAIVTKNRVYLLGGGSTYSSVSSTVYSAPINEDGTLGAWTTGTPLPVTLTRSQAIVTKNRVYLLGGFTNTIVATVYSAPINEDGTLGAWTTGTPLPGTLHSSQAIVTKNRVYLLGGFNGSSTASTVYTATFSGGLNDYTPYYDGTITATLPDIFSLPDYSHLEDPSSAYVIKH